MNLAGVEIADHRIADHQIADHRIADHRIADHRIADPLQIQWVLVWMILTGHEVEEFQKLLEEEQG